MSIRSKILEFLLIPLLRTTDRLRVVQTLSMLEHTGPFTTPKFQGDVMSECHELRLWVGSGANLQNTLALPGMGVMEAFQDPDYQDWARRCPFKREVQSDEWAERGWFWN